MGAWERRDFNERKLGSRGLLDHRTNLRAGGDVPGLSVKGSKTVAEGKEALQGAT